MANKNIKCSFCGKSQSEVNKIIAGPGVYICDECIKLCTNIIEFDESKAETKYQISTNDELPTPEEIKKVLDEYIIGQDDAKKKVAIAMRNRYRRAKLSEEMQDEVTPKNILMKGPTGCGKTEIARRLAKLIDAPFIKVEATKFTEVGYVGRDVESMIRDLVTKSVMDVRMQKINEVNEKASKIVNEILINAIVEKYKKNNKQSSGNEDTNKEAGNEANNQPANQASILSDLANLVQTSSGYKSQKEEYEEIKKRENDATETEGSKDDAMGEHTREKIKELFYAGKLEDEEIEFTMENAPKSEINQLDLEDRGISIALGNIFENLSPSKKQKRKGKVSEARTLLINQEAQAMIDMEEIKKNAIENAENNGIIFIDEIDKIASSGYKGGQDVSREGVQRDILPIVEGSVVKTKYGPVKTNHILFIGAGAFHISKVSELIPELQGRFPIRVDLDNLSEENLKRILVEPENAIIKQNIELLETEGVKVTFTDDAIDEIAKLAYIYNEQRENIGARRLHTIVDKTLEDISFEVPDEKIKDYTIDAKFIKEKFKDDLKDEDLDRFIL